MPGTKQYRGVEMSDAALSMAVQAVEVRLVHGGRRIRGIVPRSVFETRFGASEEPSSWLASYRDHASVIDAAVCRKADRQLHQNVVVLHEADIVLAPATAQPPAAAAPEAARTTRSSGHPAGAERRRDAKHKSLVHAA
jgi:phage I-like protein